MEPALFMVWIATGLVVNQLMALKLTMGSWWCRYFWSISFYRHEVHLVLNSGYNEPVAGPWWCWYSFDFVKKWTLLLFWPIRVDASNTCAYNYIHMTTFTNPLLYLVRPTFCSMTIVHFEKSFKTICMGHCLVFRLRNRS